MPLETSYQLRNLAHVGFIEGITCIEKIAGHNPEKIDYGNIPGYTYCSPEIASVGMTAPQKDAGYEVKIGKFPFTAKKLQLQDIKMVL